MITITRRILAFLVMTALMLSMFPVISMAEGSVDKWEQISFEAIKALYTDVPSGCRAILPLKLPKGGLY